AGYERVAQVATRGQFAVRGGIVDLYSWQVPLPVRLEFLGDQIDSLRAFDIEPDKISNANIQISEGWIEFGPEDFGGAFVAAATEIGEFAIGDLMLMEAKRAQFAAQLRKWRASRAKIVIYFQTEGEIERFREIMGEKEALDDVDLVEGTLA